MPLAIEYTVQRGLQFKGFVYVETIEFGTSACVWYRRVSGIEGDQLRGPVHWNGKVSKCVNTLPS